MGPEPRQSEAHVYLGKQDTWISQTSGFEKYMIKSSLALHKFLDSGNAGIFDAATQTAIRELKELFRFLSL